MDKFFNNVYDIVTSSRLLTIVVGIILFIFAFCTINYIINLLSNIRAYIVNKSNSYYLSNKKNVRMDNSTLPMPDRIELTNNVLDLISFMINSEIITEMKPYIALNNSYTIANLDSDVTNISKRVFDGINKNLFVDPDLVLTQEYLISFITKKTLTTLLDVVQQHNANIRNPQSAEE